ncbi:ferredoxin [Solihabitans fulvus]|nr:ferredoxin [Solihabitans fulvus]
MSEGRWQVGVDHGACIGSGICAGTAPAYFRIDAGKSYPVAELIDSDEVVLDAADSCPMEAILVKDASSGAVLAPEA